VALTRLAPQGTTEIVVISLMHAYQACLLLWGAHAGNATALRAVMEFSKFTCHSNVVAGAMLVSAGLAFVGALHRVGWARLLVFFIPQNVFAGAMAAGGLVATYNGAYLDGTKTYPDGTAIGWAHISGDQVAFSALFVIHFFATWRRCVDWDR
jgi:hypothetical protein